MRQQNLPFVPKVSRPAKVQRTVNSVCFHDNSLWLVGVLTQVASTLAVPEENNLLKCIFNSQMKKKKRFSKPYHITHVPICISQSNSVV